MNWILLKISWGAGGEDSFTHPTTKLNGLFRQKHLVFLKSSFCPLGICVLSPSSSNRDCLALMASAFPHSLSFPLGLLWLLPH